MDPAAPEGAGGLLQAAGAPASLALVGAGKMGGALLEGWLAIGLDPSRVTVIDPGMPDERRGTLSARGVLALPSPEGASPAEMILLAIKPQAFDEAARGLASLIAPGACLLSVMAGKTIDDIQRLLPGAGAVVRTIPNTPASVGRGITAAFAGRGVTERHRATADALLSAVGRVEWLDDEGLIDAATAVSGSGPAYVFHMVECLAQAGAAAGLPPDLAMRLARATVEGAGELLHRSPLPASVLRENVTSPGGTTAAALGVLMAPDTGLAALMRDAVAAAERRAGELSG